MTDEQRLSAPLECHRLALWDVGQFDLDLGHGQHFGGGAHGSNEGVDQTLGGIGTAHGSGSDQQVGEGLALLGGLVAATAVLHGFPAVWREVGHLQVGVCLAVGWKRKEGIIIYPC